MSAVEQEQDWELYDPRTDKFYEAPSLFDPRRRRRGRSYHRRRRRSSKFLYDRPRRRRLFRLRRYGGRIRRYRAGPRAKSWLGKLTNKKASAGWGALAFLWGINQGMPAGYGSGNPLGRLQAFFLGVPFYRLTGSTMLLPLNGTFGWTPSRAPFNVSKGLSSPVTIGAILATIYGHLPFSGLPFRGPAKRLGIPVAIGSFVGAAMDPPAAGMPGSPTKLPSPTVVPIQSANGQNRNGIVY